jgi:phospholipid/cholesterol/gamma-HCH transport system substrate-binding protein
MRPAGSIADRPSLIARIAASGALLAAVVVVVLVIFSSGSTYTLRANFQDAGGLVTGDDVLIGPSRVGSVKSIGLSPDGQAQVTLGLNSNDGPVPQGTVARIYENSLSGIANKYVVLEPPPGGPPIPNGGTITSDHTYSQVNLDQVFDAFNSRTRTGLSNFIRGQAASIQGRAHAANRTLEYLAPGLASTSNLTAEIARDQPAFNGLVVQGAQALSALASRSSQLTQLIANTNTTASAIAGQSTALEQALALLPNTLTRTTSTLGRLDTTLNSLEPLVTAAKPAVRRLAPFASSLRQVIEVGTPTIGLLNDLVRNPAGTGDLTSLMRETPSLVALTTHAFPRLIQEMDKSQHQLDYLREYTPDVIAAITNFGQASGYYDANGHYTRTQPVFNAFSINGANQLVPRPPGLRDQGFQQVSGRCPGGAVQPTPDGSAPWRVPGCNPASTPPGP